MKKINCYSKYAYYMYVILFIFTIIIGIIPFILFQNDTILFRIIWIIIVMFCVILSIYGFIHNYQYLYLENKKIILRNLFMKIIELNIEECYYEVSILPTYISRGYHNEKWICIYSKNKDVNKFKYGNSNNKKYKRIQLICTDESLNFIKKIINS